MPVAWTMRRMEHITQGQGLFSMLPEDLVDYLWLTALDCWDIPAGA